MEVRPTVQFSVTEQPASTEHSLSRALSKSDALAFRERWNRVNAYEVEELQFTPLDVKLQQFNTLLAWAHEFGWAEKLREGESEVRARWARLRKAHRG